MHDPPEQKPAEAYPESQEEAGEPVEREPVPGEALKRREGPFAKAVRWFIVACGLVVVMGLLAQMPWVPAWLAVVGTLAAFVVLVVLRGRR
jgi:Flp pilus assembly protein TadB